MYNFGVPSTIKAWFDHIGRAGVTFRYTSEGPEGLLKGKRAVITGARGGRYQGTGEDFQTPYVNKFLRFIGIQDIEWVVAEGLAMGDRAETSLREAEARLEQLARRMAGELS
ncbi:MAG: FMN-dependent NADH-azoreductase, partial [Wenzhouxiangellaceae bacterium]